MKSVVIKQECNIKGKKYKVGAKYKPIASDVQLINSLNEKGFIEPLNKEELKELLNSSKKEEK